MRSPNLLVRFLDPTPPLMDRGDLGKTRRFEKG